MPRCASESRPNGAGSSSAGTGGRRSWFGCGSTQRTEEDQGRTDNQRSMRRLGDGLSPLSGAANCRPGCFRNIEAAERFEGDGLPVVLDARPDGLFADTGGPRPERWWLCRPRASEPMDKASSSSSRPTTRASTLSRAGRRSSSPARSCRLRTGRPPTPEYTDVVHQRGRELPHFSNRSIRLRWRL